MLQDAASSRCTHTAQPPAPKAIFDFSVDVFDNARASTARSDCSWDSFDADATGDAADAQVHLLME